MPARLRLLRMTVLLLTAACAALLLVATLAASRTWDRAAERHAPQTVSAAGLNLALNDMDAQAANILLSNGDAGRGRMDVPYAKATEFYDAARHTISGDLRTLAVAAEGDAGDERAVETLTEDFARYQELLGRALENDGRAGGKADALTDYRAATDLLAERLLPEARGLVEANDHAFDATYTAERSALATQSTVLAVIGLVLFAVLVLLQWYLARRFHRVLNPALLAATACGLTALVLGLHLLTASGEQLRVARRDAFDSVVALSRARALAYDANADESRYLLDPSRRAAYEQSFLAKSQQLYGVEGATLSSYDAKLAESWARYRADHEDRIFTGEFRRELDNITFTGERPAAERTVETYADYQRDDRTIRSLLAQGKEREAIAFGISWERDKSNAHFGAWMKALDDVTGINQAAFDGAVRNGRDTATGRLPWVLGALLAAGVLTVLGLRPRLAEFR
ncbi:hypothetical protein [Streptomyces tanashiensis]|uniref:hypothetical protein n=1 Tax=Streptomyces tanashiensis TaxID=67367 RepID=UPI00167F0E15|nr:hypothetical protein [Streptomyces tanashiensis]